MPAAVKKKITRNRKKSPGTARLSAAVEARAMAMPLPLDGLQEAMAYNGSFSRRRRGTQLRARMFVFRGIYNAAWMIRYYQHGGDVIRQQAVEKFCALLAYELENTKDREALIYAVADSITCSPHGLPWEG